MRIPVFINHKGVIRKVTDASLIELVKDEGGNFDHLKITGDLDAIEAGLEAVELLRGEIENRLSGCKGLDSALQECRELEDRILARRTSTEQEVDS